MQTAPRFAVLVASTLAAGCDPYESAVAADAHTIEVVATDIAFVDGLALHPGGGILATEEYRGGGVLLIDLASGSRSYLVRDLADPDNVIAVGGRVYVTEEDARGRIVELDELRNVSTFAADLDRPEGLDRGADGALYVAEHAPGGAVYRYDADGERVRIGPVTNGEGLRCLPDGSVVVAETSEDRIVRFRPDGEKVVVSEGAVDAPDGVAYDAARDRLLVTEDAAPGRLVEIDVETGEVAIVATGLHAPQTMVIEDDGSILVAEQGEDRILRLRPEGGAP